MSVEAKPLVGEEWAKLNPAEQAVTPILTCKGCGATKTAPGGDPTDLFPSEHCANCPPWQCDDCGEMDSAAKHCSCWVDLTTMPLADQKALFAADGQFNLGADGQLTVARAATPPGPADVPPVA